MRQPAANAATMIRSLVAALLGAVAAAVAIEAARQPAWSEALGAPDAALETAIATEAWPICTTMDAVAENADWAHLDADFAAGKTALGAGDWSVAIAALKLAALRDPRNADIQNHIGYAYRRLRQLEPAFAHYRQALALNPRHRSAHEHLGEAYLATGDLAKAEEQLASLTISASSPAPNTPICRPRSRPTGKQPRPEAASRPTANAGLHGVRARTDACSRAPGGRAAQRAPAAAKWAERRLALY